MTASVAQLWCATPVQPDAFYAAARLSDALREIESAVDSLDAATDPSAAPEIKPLAEGWKTRLSAIHDEIDVEMRRLTV